MRGRRWASSIGLVTAALLMASAAAAGTTGTDDAAAAPSVPGADAELTPGEVESPPGNQVDPPGESVDRPTEDPAPIDLEAAVGIEKLTNGIAYEQAPGSLVAAGSSVEWTYVITNLGEADLQLDSLTDSWRAGDGTTGETEVDLEPLLGEVPGAPVPPDPRELVLEPGEYLVIEHDGVAIAGQYTNTAEVVATPVDASGAAIGEEVTASDTSWYVGGEAGVTLRLEVGGQEVRYPPGPGVAVGHPAEWHAIVTNTGNVPLTAVELAQLGGVAGAKVQFGKGRAERLEPGQSVTFQADDLIAARGQFAGTATVTAQSEIGEVRAGDQAWFYGGTPSLGARVAVNGVTADAAPGSVIAAGSSVETTVTVTNTGETWLASITPTLTRSTDGTTATLTPTTDATGPLAPGGTRSWTVDDAAPAGQSEVSVDVTAVAVTAYGDRLAQQPAAAQARTFFLAGEAGIAVEKRINGEVTESAPGLTLAVGDTVTWTYAVTNNGSLPLGPVRVQDVESTPASVAGSAPGTVVHEETIASIPPGETVTLTASGTARAGLYRNTVTATVPYPSAPDGSISAADEAHYTGGGGGLAVTKELALVDEDGEVGSFADSAEAAAGTSVVWRVVVTNIGETTLSSLVVLDPAVSHGERAESLEPGDSVTFDFAATAHADIENTATATALTPTREEVSGEATASLTLVEDAVAEEETEDEDEDGDDGGSPLVWIVLGVVVLAGIGVAIYLQRRRSSDGDVPSDGNGTGDDGLGDDGPGHESFGGDESPR